MVRDSDAGEWVSRGIDDMFVDVTEGPLEEEDAEEEVRNFICVACERGTPTERSPLSYRFASR